MRHEDFRLEITNISWLNTQEGPVQPTLTIQYTGKRSTLRDHLYNPTGSPPAADEIDVTFRYQSPVSDSDTPGVLAVTSNVTGDYILELNTNAALVHDFVRAAQRFVDETNHDSAYVLRLSTDTGILAVYEKTIFLIYAPDGTFLRHQSLVPNNIEM